MSRYVKEVNTCLLQIQKGDLTKLKDLFELTANHLREVVMRYLVNVSDCNDVIVETFIRVSQYIQSFNPNKDGYNWMCTIARNVVKSFNIKAKEFESLDILKNCEPSENIIDKIDIKIDISLALKDLDSINKEILQKRYYQGETLEEIANALN